MFICSKRGKMHHFRVAEYQPLSTLINIYKPSSTLINPYHSFLKTLAMNQAHLHLLLNHLPILGTLFGILILAGGFLLKNNTVKRTALGIFVLSALCAIPAYLTGEGAEEVVESLPGVSENLMEAHEELANIFLWMVGALGLFSLATFYADFKSKTIASTLYILTFVAAIGTMVFAQRVGTSGGEIRHTEIRSGAASAGVENTLNGNVEKEGDDD